jgi:hypothetical protein
MEVVLRKLTIALVAALSGGLLSSASAMTVTKPLGATAPALQHVDYKKGKSFHKRGKYRAGGRYNKAPGNWHRFDKRPGDWQRRGCIIVGPIWWCP